MLTEFLVVQGAMHVADQLKSLLLGLKVFNIHLLLELSLNLLVHGTALLVPS